MISVVTYNVLADSYLRREYYPRVDARLLVRGARQHALLDRVASFGADVICLQEVEPDVFERLRARLPGYTGEWARKGSKPDGCATFFRSGNARHRVVTYGDGTGHVALVTEIADVTIANTHLQWAADGSTGVRQASELVRALPSSKCVVCGDFNAEPASNVLRVFAGFSDAHDASIATFNSNARAKKIDFILHTNDLASESLPAPRVLDDTILPSDREPSDHVPLVARISFRVLP